MTYSLESLREEHQSAGIGPSIRTLLERIVRATAPAYPPAQYSESGSWSREALEDSLHDWVEVRLVGRNDLPVMISTAGSLGSLRAALTTSYSQFLINRRKRSSVVNLFQRTLRMLEEDERFEEVTAGARPGDKLWTMTGGTTEKSHLSMSLLVSRAAELSDADLEVVRYGPYSLKSSPILRNAQLGTFLAHLLTSSDGALETATIVEVMKHRFSLFEFDAAIRDEVVFDALAAAEAEPGQTIEAKTLAQSVLRRLAQDELSVLVAVDQHQGDIAAAAKELGISPYMAKQALTKALRLISDYAESAEEARVVYQIVLESLF